MQSLFIAERNYRHCVFTKKCQSNCFSLILRKQVRSNLFLVKCETKFHLKHALTKILHLSRKRVSNIFSLKG